MREVMHAFDCQGVPLMAIVSLPAEAPALGVLIIVGGPQYRVGSHRQFVLMARAWSAQGLAAMRFDVRGMGDAPGESRSFEQLDADITSAVGAFKHAVPSLQRVVLLGLCDGASAALMWALAHPNHALVQGVALINPWVRSTQSLAKAQVSHYYRDRFFSASFWRKLARGGVNWRAPWQFGRAVLASRRWGEQGQAGKPTFQQQMADAIAHPNLALWLALSGRDLTAAEFLQLWDADPGWQAARSRQGLRRADFPDADHTFSQRVQLDAVTQWLAQEWLAWLPTPTNADAHAC
jgi:uncharacterized protein